MFPALIPPLLTPLLTALILILFSTPSFAQIDDTTTDILQNARPAATRPTEAIDPSTQPSSDPIGTLHAKPARGARLANIELNNGIHLEGFAWTTVQTPLRLWQEQTKSYLDIDWDLIKTAVVTVDSETLEADWRWLKDGSDIKVYSGKKYPLVVLHYTFTLVNGQTVAGPVVAPIFIDDGQKIRNLALYKKYQGKLDQTLDDVVYIKSITLAPPTAADATALTKTTTKLPLIPD